MLDLDFSSQSRMAQECGHGSTARAVSPLEKELGVERKYTKVTDFAALLLTLHDPARTNLQKYGAPKERAREKESEIITA